MIIFDLDILDRGNDGLYDLSKRTHDWSVVSPRYLHVVQKSEEMRIDQVCFNIYGNTNNTGFLLNYNNIDNPLNIREGDQIFYVREDLVDSYKLQETLFPTSIEIDLPSRTTRKDKSRESYIENSGQLPPTVLDRPTPSVTVNGNNIVIGRNTGI
jgi:hypothetical protein